MVLWPNGHQGRCCRSRMQRFSRPSHVNCSGARTSVISKRMTVYAPQAAIINACMLAMRREKPSCHFGSALIRASNSFLKCSLSVK